MTMLEFVQVATRDQVPQGGMYAAWAGGRKVLIYHIDDEYYATDEQCTHRECSLAIGPFSGKVIVCPCHFARFDVTTGQVLSPPATIPLPTYPVKVEGNRILVGVDITDIV
jgi:3-phenylpropionate/trans-cinnamate dioxygenase ferredoxin subunit